MAKGKRGHCRRSSVGVLPFTLTHTPSRLVFTMQLKHLRGQMPAWEGNPQGNRRKNKDIRPTCGVRSLKAAEAVALRSVVSGFAAAGESKARAAQKVGIVQ